MSRFDISKTLIRRPLHSPLKVAVIATLVTVVGAKAQAQEPLQPKLVVGIVVEDLRSDYLTLLRDNFGPGGWSRLLGDGVVIANADFGTPLDVAAATALIYTGAAPAVNGVPAETVFDRATLHASPVFNDPEYRGYYTTETLSPAGLQVTTISDEARVAGGGITYAYSVAPDAPQALIMAGHAGNAGFWINNANDSWATTTFYKDVPPTLNSRNRMQPLRARLDTITWSPMLDATKYPLLPDFVTKYPFRYQFRQKGPDKIYAYKSSPKVNDEVTDFAIDNLKSLRLGKNSGMDMLSVAYTLEPYAYSNSADNRYEQMDAYYRLDRNLARLFNAIDSCVGRDNALIFVAGTPPSQRTRRDDEKWQLPYGEFSTKKAISLLNLYLIAKYGNGDWAQAYHNGQIYLNHKLIEERNQSVEELRRESARFLERMTGVKKAYSIDEIVEGRDAFTAPLRQSTAIGMSGDVWLSVLPGWQVIDDHNAVGTPTNQVERPAAPLAPVFILAHDVEHRVIDTPVDARAIAPTITRLLRIRSPNAASVSPLILNEK